MQDKSRKMQKGPLLALLLAHSAVGLRPTTGKPSPTNILLVHQNPPSSQADLDAAFDGLKVFGAAQLPLARCAVSATELCRLCELDLGNFKPKQQRARVRRVSNQRAALESSAAFYDQPVLSASTILGVATCAWGGGVLDWLRGAFGGSGLHVSVLALLCALIGSAGLVDWLMRAADSLDLLRPPPSLRPERREAVVRHEAGHFFACVLLGLPVTDVYIDGWRSLLANEAGAPHVSFHSEALLALRAGKACSTSEVDTLSVVLMAGLAAEALHCGAADGGAADQAALAELLAAREAATAEPSALSLPEQGRWAAANAVLLMRAYPEAFEALTDALRGRASVEECVSALERAFVSSQPRSRRAHA